VLWRNREALRRNDVLYPGQERGAHFHAVQDLLGFYFHRHKDPRVPGAWDRLVDEVRSGPCTSVISHEFLAGASADGIDRAIQALTFAEVHVIYTVRDLARQIPSAWQEDLKNRNALSFAEFVRAYAATSRIHTASASCSGGCKTLSVL
jgi:hypothetical protein